MFPTGVLYVAAVLIWGSTWIAIKYQLGVVDPVVSVVYRFSLSAFAIGIYCTGTRKQFSFTKTDHGFMLLQGICLFGLNYWLVYLSEMHLTSGLVAVVFSTIVFFNIINGYLFLKQHVGINVFVGAAFGIVGIVLVFWPEVSGFRSIESGLKGLAFIFCGTLLASFGNIISARNQKYGMGVVQTNMYSMAYGALFMAVAACATGKPFTIDVSFSYVISLLYLALIGSVVAFGCYLTLIGRIGAVKASYANMLFPLVALVISTIAEGYQWTGLSIAGIVLIVSGNYVALSPNVPRILRHSMLSRRVIK